MCIKTLTHTQTLLYIHMYTHIDVFALQLLIPARATLRMLFDCPAKCCSKFRHYQSMTLDLSQRQQHVYFTVSVSVSVSATAAYANGFDFESFAIKIACRLPAPAFDFRFGFHPAILVAKFAFIIYITSRFYSHCFALRLALSLLRVCVPLSVCV